MRAVLLPVAAGLLGACTLAPGEGAGDGLPPFPNGIYSNVAMSARTGDLGGFEVEFRDVGGAPVAEFVLCEGWCNATATAPVERDGKAFTFAASESYEGGEGTRVLLNRYHVMPQGRSLVLKGSIDGQPIFASRTAVLLRRLDKPYGLQVARQEGP